MGKPRAWRRLLWKGLREDFVVVMAAMAVPAVLFYVAGTYDVYSWQRGSFALPAALGSYLLLILWAVQRGDREKHGVEYTLTHLPVRPTVVWTTSFAIPALFSAGLGAWFGYWVHFASSWPIADLIWAGALEFLAVYALCYYFSAAISKWLALAIAIAHVAAGGSLIGAWDLKVLWDTEAILFVGSTAVGAVCASLLFSWLSGKRTLQTRQAVSLLVMVIIAFGAPTARGIDTTWFYGEKPPARQALGIYYSDLVAIGPAKGSSSSLEYVDQRTNRRVTHKFSAFTQPIGVVNRDQVYLAQQLLGSRAIRVLKWDTANNRIERLASFDTGQDALSTSTSATLDPDGRYALLAVPAMVGSGADLWMADLNTGKGHLIAADTPYTEICSTAWLTDEVVLALGQSYYKDLETRFSLFKDQHASRGVKMTVVRIDLHDMKVTPVSIPATEGDWSRRQ